MSEANTLFLRLEGPLQAWGDTSKFVIRRTMDAPTKSGVLGLICCAMGWSRRKVVESPIPDDALCASARRLINCREEDHEPRRALLDLLDTLKMGVRIDRPGMRWWDYHTVGAGIGMVTAGGGLKTGAQGTLITRREYLADASFLVAFQGDVEVIEKVRAALASPKWPVFLGRKSCPPSVPVLARPREGESWTNPAGHDGLNAALAAIPWNPRYKDDPPPATGKMETLVEWRSTSESGIAPDDAEVWYDVPVCFDPPVHEPRFVLRDQVPVTVGNPIQQPTPAPPRPRANYSGRKWKNERKDGAADRRLARDHHLCVFCKSPGPRMTVQHVTYRRAGGDETQEDLRSLCGLCHDAVTMLEYGLGMGLDRINPEESRWRDSIIAKRDEIVRFRSLETRRRRLSLEEVE